MLNTISRGLIAVVLLAGACLAVQTEPTGPPSEAPTPTQILRTFRTIYIQTSTWLSKPEMLAGELQKRREFDQWGLAIVNNISADVAVTIDHQPGWFYYTYSMVHTATGTVLASGTVTAWDGKKACGKVAEEIIKRIKRARISDARQS